MSAQKDHIAINWQPIIELAIAAAMVIGTVVPLYVHTDGKLHNALEEMRQEMKDFHGRLCEIAEKTKK